MSWKEDLEFLMEPEDVVEVEVRGRTMRFYPLSVRSLFQIRSLSSGLAKALGLLFRDTSRDVAQEQVAQGDRVETRIQAISPELAAKREEEKREAVQALLDLLTNQDTASTIGMLLLDSLRDLAPKGGASRKDAFEFVKGLSLTTLQELLLGLAKANSGILRPLAAELRKLMPSAEEAPGDEESQ